MAVRGHAHRSTQHRRQWPINNRPLWSGGGGGVQGLARRGPEGGGGSSPSSGGAQPSQSFAGSGDDPSTMGSAVGVWRCFVGNGRTPIACSCALAPPAHTAHSAVQPPKSVEPRPPEGATWEAQEVPPSTTAPPVAPGEWGCEAGGGGGAQDRGAAWGLDWIGLELRSFWEGLV